MISQVLSAWLNHIFSLFFCCILFFSHVFLIYKKFEQSAGFKYSWAYFAYTYRTCHWQLPSDAWQHKRLSAVWQTVSKLGLHSFSSASQLSLLTESKKSPALITDAINSKRELTCIRISYFSVLWSLPVHQRSLHWELWYMFPSYRKIWIRSHRHFQISSVHWRSQIW